jgi:putative tryptophan/tyrosine transport system substrate-binding protein
VIGHATVAVEAFLRETRMIPIIFVAVSDPVGSGFIADERDPGANITGVRSFDQTLGTKWLEALRSIAPSVKRVGCLFNPDTSSPGGVFMRELETAGRSVAMEVMAAPARGIDEIKAAVGSLGRDGGALVVIPEPFTATHRDLIIAAAAENHVPAVYPNAFFARRGGLISYGIDQADLLRVAAEYADRILRGARPNELPIQGPTKFELVINMTTAKSLGLAVPPSLRASACEVIE